MFGDFYLVEDVVRRREGERGKFIGEKGAAETMILELEAATCCHGLPEMERYKAEIRGGTTAVEFDLRYLETQASFSSSLTLGRRTKDSVSKMDHF